MSTLPVLVETGPGLADAVLAEGEEVASASGFREPATKLHRLPEWLKRPIPATGGMYFTRNLIERAGAGDGLRERPLPEPLRVLDPANGHVHGSGRRLHPSLRVLRRQAGTSPRPSRSTSPSGWPRPARLGLRHVVITSVTRDDLPDGGAEHFRRCILAVRPRRGDDRGAHARLRRPERGDRHRPLGRARGLQPQPRDRRPAPAARPAKEPVRRQPGGPRARQEGQSPRSGPRAA